MRRQLERQNLAAAAAGELAAAVESFLEGSSTREDLQAALAKFHRAAD